MALIDGISQWHPKAISAYMDTASHGQKFLKKLRKKPEPAPAKSGSIEEFRRSQAAVTHVRKGPPLVSTPPRTSLELTMQSELEHKASASAIPPLKFSLVLLLLHACVCAGGPPCEFA